MEEEAERKRQAPLKLEPEEKKQKPHREQRDQKKRESERPAQPVPQVPQKLSADRETEVVEEDAFQNGEDLQEEKPQLKPVMRPITAAPSVSSASGNVTPNSPANESPCGIIIPGENTPELQPLEENRPKIGLSLKLGESRSREGSGLSLSQRLMGCFPSVGTSNSPCQLAAGKRKKLSTVESVFNKFDDEEIDEPQRKRKLVPLDYGDNDKSLGLDGAELAGSKNNINTEEKRKHIKSLIEKIPTARPELFSYPLDWTMVDSVKTHYSRCFKSHTFKISACYLTYSTLFTLWFSRP